MEKNILGIRCRKTCSRYSSMEDGNCVHLLMLQIPKSGSYIEFSIFREKNVMLEFNDQLYRTQTLSFPFLLFPRRLKRVGLRQDGRIDLYTWKYKSNPLHLTDLLNCMKMLFMQNRSQQKKSQFKITLLRVQNRTRV